MKKITVFAALAAFVGLTQAQPFATWSRYREVTINTPSNIAASVANYPVLVRLSNSSVAAGANVLTDALANGADVRFTDSTGMNSLSYEIDTWNSTGAAIWVRLPSIAPGAPTKIRMYWGKAGSTTTSSAGSVFDSATGFVGVWHLGNAAGISARPNAITGAPAATPANDFAAGTFGGGAGSYVAPTGVVGNGDAFRGAGTRTAPEAGSDYLDIGNPAGFVAGTYDGTNTFTGYNDFSTGLTYSVWVKAATPAGNYTYFLELANTNACNGNIQVFRPAVDARIRYEHCNGTTSGGTNQTANGSLIEGTWQFFTVTMGTGSTPAYTGWMNGVRSQGPTNRTQPIQNTLRTNAWIGKSNYNGDYYWAGAFDEARLSKVVRDTNWIRMDYATQRPDSSVVALGSTVAAKALYYPQKNAVYVINTAISNNVPVVSGAVTGNYAVNPTTMPAGLTFTAATGVISGTPTAASSATQFIVTATVGGTPASDTITIAVSAGTPPGAPTGVTGVRGNAQVAVTWVAPVNTGSSAISGYLARATQDTTKTCTTTGALTCNVTGLTNGTSYTFVVRATNGAGNGAFSAASAAVTPATTPGASGTPVATVASATSASVTWTAPTNNGGSAITDYYVTSSPGGLQCYSAPIASPTCTVTGLTTGTAYTFTVVAANAVGNGTASAASNSVTPVSILPGSFSIRLTGASDAFRFKLTEKAMETTEAFTMTISDVHGRVVWSKTVHPSTERIRELVWNGKTTTGQSASAGVYLVKVGTVTGGKISDFVQMATDIK